MKNCWSRLAAITMLIACGGEKSTEPPPPPIPTSVQLSATSLTMRMGESSQLTATVMDQHGVAMSGQAVAWSSSDTTKISITSSGLARGVRPGTATLTAASGGITKSAAATVLAPQLTVEDGASVTKSIGVAGGTVSAQAASGARYTLTVPPTALPGAVEVTLTPITAIQNLPTGTTVVAAVRLRPDGLAFLAPATLTMDLPAAALTTNLVGLRFGDDGSAIHMVPVRRAGTSLTISIPHFSGAGAATSTVPPLIPLDGSGTVAGDAMSQLMLQELNAQASGNYDVAAITAILVSWYTSHVKPHLQIGATNESSLLAAMGAWATWRNTIATFAPSITGALDAATSSQQSEGRSLAATALQAAVQRNNAACIAQTDLAAARKVLQWQGVAEYHALATSANALDRSTVLNGLCVKVGYGPITLADSLVAMQSAQLKVQAGIRFGPGPTLFFANPSIDVGVTATGSTDGATRHYQTDATGTAQTTLTPRGGTPLGVTLRSCINDAVGGLISIVGLTLLDVCRDTTLSRTVVDSAVYFRDFTTGAVGPEWSSPLVTTSPSGQRFLGTFGNTSTTLSLASLPAHTQVVLEFDLNIIESWNGNGNPASGSTPDIIEISVVGGPVLKRTTFSNRTRDVQAYPGDYPGAANPAGTGSFAQNALGYPLSNDGFGDSSYRLRFAFNHTGGTVTLRFASQQSSGQNERWGVDNVRVSVVP
jgi:hypothetical protein